MVDVVLAALGGRLRQSGSRGSAVVTLDRLNRSLARVVRELDQHGLWNHRLNAIEVRIVPYSWDCYGWQWYGSSGDICIPAVSMARIGDWFRGSYKSLADVLRYEYGHALADTHRGLFRSSRFRKVFHASHEDESAFEHDAEYHFSAYAATNASEDFAETFMHYLRHRGQLPAWHRAPVKAAKWQFITELCEAVRDGKRRW